MKPKLTIHGREIPLRVPKAQFADRNLTECRGNSERAYVSQGIDFFFSGDIPKATESLMHALSINPNNAEACLYMGRIAKCNGSTAAISYFTQAIATDRMNSEAYMERGLALLERRSGSAKDALDAKADFETALALNPHEARAHYYIGMCRHRMMEYSEALKSFETYSDLEPVDVEAAQFLEKYRTMTRYYMHYTATAQRWAPKIPN